MPHAFTLLRRVQFAETDAAGIMHFSHYFRFMEETEHAFYRSLGFSVHGPGGAEQGSWPRIRASCDYRHPLRFEDEVEICLDVLARTDKTVTYRFTFRKRDGDAWVETAQGEMAAIYAVKRPGESRLRAASIPAGIAAMLTPGEG